MVRSVRGPSTIDCVTTNIPTHVQINSMTATPTMRVTVRPICPGGRREGGSGSISPFLPETGSVVADILGVDGHTYQSRGKPSLAAARAPHSTDRSWPMRVPGV
jgi:hypothetical protein